MAALQTLAVPSHLAEQAISICLNHSMENKLRRLEAGARQLAALGNALDFIVDFALFSQHSDGMWVHLQSSQTVAAAPNVVIPTFDCS